MLDSGTMWHFTVTLGRRDISHIIYTHICEHLQGLWETIFYTSPEETKYQLEMKNWASNDTETQSNRQLLWSAHRPMGSEQNQSCKLRTEQGRNRWTTSTQAQCHMETATANNSQSSYVAIQSTEKHAKILHNYREPFLSILYMYQQSQIIINFIRYVHLIILIPFVSLLH